MGSVSHFDLTGIADRFGIGTFVETGTGRGDGLAYAEPLFDDLLSCELHAELARAVRARFAENPKIRIFALNSVDFLDYVCLVLPRNEPVLFWLDAHFPGADYGYAAFDEGDIRPDIRLPLANELNVILRKRPRGLDVVLIDDARIWLDGPFQYGNLPERLRAICPTARNIDFVHDMFGLTHTVDVLYDHEGYIQLMPREIIDG